MDTIDEHLGDVEKLALRRIAGEGVTGVPAEDRRQVILDNEVIVTLVRQVRELKATLAHRTDAHDVDGRALLTEKKRVLELEAKLIASEKPDAFDLELRVTRLRAGLAQQILRALPRSRVGKLGEQARAEAQVLRIEEGR